MSLYEKYITLFENDCYWEGFHVYNNASELKNNGEILRSQRLFSGLYVVRYNVSGCAFHLGEIAFTQKDYRLSYQYFSECLSIIPTHQKAESYLEKLSVEFSIEAALHPLKKLIVSKFI